MIGLYVANHHFYFDLNATNNMRESQPNEMLSGYDYGNVVYSCERVMGYVVHDASYLMAKCVTMMWSDHMFQL